MIAAKRIRSELLSQIIVPFLLLGLASTAIAGEAGPPVGSVAPEIGPCQWLQRDQKHPTEIAGLRGQVVLIHMFAVGCVP